MIDFEDQRAPRSRDEVVALVAQREHELDELEWVGPRLYLRFRGRRVTWIYRWFWQHHQRSRTLGEYTDERSGNGKITYPVAQQKAARLDMYRKFCPDLHELAALVRQRLSDDGTSDADKAEIRDRAGPLLAPIDEDDRRERLRRKADDAFCERDVADQDCDVSAADDDLVNAGFSVTTLKLEWGEKSFDEVFDTEGADDADDE